MNKLLRWEIAGIFIIFFVGTSLHFVFEWTNYWRPAALIAAVNESTWEHFKMAFWPGLLFAIVEFQFLKKMAANFFFAKFIGLLVMPIVTVILFYGYTGITGHHILIFDIFIFFSSVTIGQLTSYKIMTIKELGVSVNRGAFVGLLVMTLLFSLLSYYPRKNFLFRHPESDEYGILEDYEHHDH